MIEVGPREIVITDVKPDRVAIMRKLHKWTWHRYDSLNNVIAKGAMYTNPREALRQALHCNEGCRIDTSVM